MSALHAGIQSAVAAYGATMIANVEVPALASFGAPRLDALVAQLWPLRGQVLLGAVAADHALLLDEALRELGAAWLHRGEHVSMNDGASRHRMSIAHRNSGRVEVQHLSGWLDARSPRWEASLGADMASNVLATHPPVAAFRSMALSPRPPSGTRATAYTDAFLSFVTRI